MKQSRILTFLLMSIAVSVVATIDISAADPAKTVVDPAKTVVDPAKTVVDPAKTVANPAKTVVDPAKTVADAGGKADNTIGFIGLGLSILNSIGLGILFILNKKDSNQLKEEVKSSQQTIESLKSKDRSLDTHIKKVDGDRQHSVNETNKQIGNIQQSINKNNKQIEDLQQSVSKTSQQATSARQSVSVAHHNHRAMMEMNTPYSLNSEGYLPTSSTSQPAYIKSYNDRQSDFQNKYQITPVSRETENFNQSRAAQTDSVVLEEDRQGNYWLFSDNSEIYLVPKQKLKITDNRISNTKDLFECQDYNEQNYDAFTLIKPALLEVKGNGNWKLKEKGKLQFG